MKAIEAFEKPVFVFQPLLPDKDKFNNMIDMIWESKHITNNGNMAKKLEVDLAKFLEVQNLSLFSHGATALQLSCKVLRLSGEVITTPFTFAATPHALAWNNIKPVFCDIENDSLNINPKNIESLITQETTAIMPVHVFGNPCKVDDIERIANKYGLKVIYDGAHAFGVKINDKSIGSFGDITMFSLHATKVYNTIEGGALSFNSPHMKERADSLRNFGIRGEDIIVEPGTNDKLNEVQAAVGLLLLEVIEDEIKRRKEITYLYRDLLKDVPGIKLFEDMEGVKHNYPYFIIRVDKDEFGITRDELYQELKQYNIISRRYFYPLCSQFPCYRNLPTASNLPVAEKATLEVLSLPIYGSLSNDYVERICSVIKQIRAKSTVN